MGLKLSPPSWPGCRYGKATRLSWTDQAGPASGRHCRVAGQGSCRGPGSLSPRQISLLKCSRGCAYSGRLGARALHACSEVVCFGGPAQSPPFPLLPVSFPALASPGMAEERAASRRPKPPSCQNMWMGGAWWLNRSPYLLFYLVFNSYLMSSPKNKTIRNHFLKCGSSVCSWQ